MYKVYITYCIDMPTGLFGVKHILKSFFTREEAVNFCEENNWEHIDENGFCWSLDIE